MAKVGLDKEVQIKIKFMVSVNACVLGSTICKSDAKLHHRKD